MSKQADREKEKEERKKKKLDKLRQEFKCDFNDPEYNKERSEVTDKAHEALEQGISAEFNSIITQYLILKCNFQVFRHHLQVNLLKRSSKLSTVGKA